MTQPGRFGLYPTATFWCAEKVTSTGLVVSLSTRKVASLQLRQVMEQSRFGTLRTLAALKPTSNTDSLFGNLISTTLVISFFLAPWTTPSNCGTWISTRADSLLEVTLIQWTRSISCPTRKSSHLPRVTKLFQCGTFAQSTASKRSTATTMLSTPANSLTE